ncbi:MAG: hypothetical protein HYR72_10325 [Deltaproteobacteria bacterium]|nr:hypothetical protein [Deltaproteobacteria bacterium]MBI3388096.1 hypothetical protein [Deltaproteobacteria bacterium]
MTIGSLALGIRSVVAAAPTLNGHVEYDTFGYPDSATLGQRWENLFAATARGTGQFGSTLTWQFEGRAVADDADYTAGAYSLRNATRRRPYLSLITALLDYRPMPEVRVSVGKQLVNWSVFDELGPANLMTPHDESDAFHRVEQGVNGISVHYSVGSAFAELVVVPLASTPSRLPQGRWNIIQGSDVVEVQNQPPVRLNETQAGARVGTHIGSLEASLIGYVGRDTEAIFVPGPLIVIIENGVPTFKAQIIDTFPTMRAGGVSASYPWGDRLLFRREAVYFNSPDPNRDDFLHNAWGVEYALDDWRFVLNYLRDDQIIAAREEVTNKGERRFFQSFISGEARYDAGGRFRGRLRGGYDANGEFALMEPEVSYRLWQTLWVTLLGQVTGVGKASYTNNKDSYFTSIRHEDRLGTRIEYDF